MPIIDTFSKRQKRQSGRQDVFVYDSIPAALRVQICKIWADRLGGNSRAYMPDNPVYAMLHRNLAVEFGLFSFPNWFNDNAKALVEFFMNGADLEQSLDIVDYSFRCLLTYQGDLSGYGARITGRQAVKDLNQRLREHAVGYTFLVGPSPQLVRVDNEHLHAEAVIPALTLLHNESFKGADDEYRRAHEHYRHGRHKECLNECLKAFESTMKTICNKQGWSYKQTDSASTLITTCLGNGLLPLFMQTQLGTLKSALESGVPTVRNKLSGHGQGEQPREVSSFFSEYLLHLTATTIVFLVEAYKASR